MTSSDAEIKEVLVASILMMEESTKEELLEEFLFMLLVGEVERYPALVEKIAKTFNFNGLAAFQLMSIACGDIANTSMKSTSTMLMAMIDK